MLYRLDSNDIDYLHLMFDDEQVIELLGEENLIQIECAPFEYAGIWKPLTLHFAEALGRKTKKPIPDLQFHCGHLFLSKKAGDVLVDHLSKYGELLPVEYEDGSGYIFNPLTILKANAKQSIKEADGEVTSLVFDEEKLIFKTEFDGFYGVFCNDEFKSLADSNQLTGVVFEPDLSYIFLRLDTSEKAKKH